MKLTKKEMREIIFEEYEKIRNECQGAEEHSMVEPLEMGNENAEQVVIFDGEGNKVVSKSFSTPENKKKMQQVVQVLEDAGFRVQVEDVEMGAEGMEHDKKGGDCGCAMCQAEKREKMQHPSPNMPSEEIYLQDDEEENPLSLFNS